MADTTFHSITLPNTDPARIPDMAAEFNTATSYTVRDYCTRQGILYRCTTAHTGAWNDSHFQATNLDNEFDDKLKIPFCQASEPDPEIVRKGDLWIDTDEDSPILSIDPAPIAGSTNAVQSGGVKILIDAVDVQKASRYLLTGDYSTSATYEKGQLVFWYPETFSTSHSYVVGESCVHNGVVYKCTTAHTGAWNVADFEAQHNASTDTLYRCITDIKVPESWTAAHWQATNINTEINRLRESEADTDMIAENYGDSSSYAVGDYVVHNSDLFRCVSAVSDTGSWDPDDWQQVKLADDVRDLNSALNNILNVPLINGNYILKANVINGIVTYTWIAEV